MVWPGACDEREIAKGIRNSAAVIRARVEECLQHLMASDGSRKPLANPFDWLLPAVKARLQESEDIVFREFYITGLGRRAVLIYVDGMVKKEDLEEKVLEPLQSLPHQPLPARGVASLADVVDKVMPVGEAKMVHDLDAVILSILGGRTVLMIEGFDGVLVIANPGWKGREIEKPAIEFTLRGPREAFSETLSWNTALLRRRLRDPSLVMKKIRVGRRSQTETVMAYLKGVVNPALVEEVEKRLGAINVDGILDSGYIEQLIEDTWYSPFPTVDGSERPDVVVSYLLEGRVAILVDNSSFVLVVPATIDGLFHSPEDSYDRWLPATLLRLVRIIGGVLALIMPSLYVALVAYHPGLLPTKLALSLTASREGVAFPVVLEALIAQLSLELLKEAGFRMPSPVGQIFGVVGGLVLGDLGVRAGFFSELMVITIALTAVASFSIPTPAIGTVIRLLGLPLMLATTLLGLFGMALGLMMIMAHLVTLTSFGVPYILPYGYFRDTDWKDSILKYPLRSMVHRPSFLKPRDERSQIPPQGLGGAGGVR